MKPGSVAIAGAAETEDLGKLPQTSAVELAAQSVRRALAGCGLSIHDVDGVAAAELPPIDVAHHLGVDSAWIDGTGIGGCSFLVHVRHAAAAIIAGMADVILVVHGESGRSGIGQPPWAVNPAGLDGQFDTPYGVWGPPACMTIPAMRYMHEIGLSHEQLASVAVAQRKWAALTPRASMREPITVEDVLASRLIAYPFHLLECCLVTARCACPGGVRGRPETRAACGRPRRQGPAARWPGSAETPQGRRFLHWCW